MIRDGSEEEEEEEEDDDDDDDDEDGGIPFPVISDAGNGVASGAKI